MELDLSRIEHLFLKENYLLGLGFTKGYVFYRSKRVERFVYLYDEIASMTADAYNSEAMLGIAARQKENAFRIDANKDHLYQIFRGLSPSALRTYLGVPYTTPQDNLDVAARLTKSDFGYIDGFASPLNNPGPETEVWIPYKLDIGFAEYNPLTDTIYPLLKFVVNRYQVMIVRDTDLIRRILDRRIECRLATVGGLSDFDYPFREYYDLDPITLDATDDQIAAAVARS